MIDDKPIGFITVRTSSTRLPEKCLLPLGDETVISHVVKGPLLSESNPLSAQALIRVTIFLRKYQKS